MLACTALLNSNNYVHVGGREGPGKRAYNTHVIIEEGIHIRGKNIIMPDIDAENPPEQQVEEKKEAPASKSMVGIIYPPPEVRSIPQPLHCKWCTLVRTCSPHPSN